MRITRTVKAGRDSIVLGFEWQGGAYIEVCRGQAHARPQEVINVWDYATDKATIPFTREALSAEVDEWIDEYGRKNLIHDVTENWSW